MSVEKDAQEGAQVPMAKLDVYAHLLTYDDPSTIDTKAVGALAKVSPKSVASMIGQLKTNPKVYLQLLAAGYVDAQMPAWVLRPAEGDAALAKGAKVADGVLAMPTKTQETPALETGSLQPEKMGISTRTTNRTTTRSIVDLLQQQGGALTAEQLASLSTEQLTALGMIRDASGQVYRVQSGQGGAYTKSTMCQQNRHKLNSLRIFLVLFVDTYLRAL